MCCLDVEGLFEASPDGVAILDADGGRIRRVNERCARLCDRPTETLEGASLRDLAPDGWTPPTPVPTLVERAGEGPVAFDWRVEQSSGEVVDLRCSMGPLPDSDPTRTVVTVRERRSGDRPEDRSDREVRELIDGMNDAVMVVDTDGQFVDVNRATVERLGYTRSELLSMGPADVSPPGHDSRVHERIQQLERTGTLVFETVQTTADGREIPVEVSATRIEYRGDPAILSVARDITDRKERQRRLRTFEQAVKQAGHAVYITDADGEIEYVNPAFEEITGFDADEAVGETPSILSTGDQNEEYYENLWETVLVGDVWEEEIENQRADGRRYYADQTIAPIVEDGNVVRFVAIQQDITDRKRREQALEKLHRATRELIAADTREEVATIASETAESILELPLNGVHLYDGEGLRPVAATSMTRDVLGDLPTFSGEGSLAWEAFTAEEARVSENVRQEPSVFNEETPVGSEMILPLGDHGVVLIGSTAVDDFDETDVALGGILAANVEAAMDLVRHERELQRYRQLIENVPVGVFRTTPGIAGEFVEVNPAIVEMFDAESEAALLETPVAKLYQAPGQRELLSRQLEREGIVVAEEFRYETLAGNKFWGAMTAIRHETDGEVYYDGILQDVTERREKERELRFREQRFRRLFEDHNAAMLLVDPDTGAVERANDAAADFYGYGRSELTAMDIQEINQLSDEEVAARRREADEGERNRFIFPHELADGEVRHVEVDSSPIHTGGRRLLFSILHDVTERKETRETLERQNEQLELLNRLVRHDIRNDMSVVLGHADLLEEYVEGEGRTYLDTLRDHGEHVVELTRTARELMRVTLEEDDDPGSVPLPEVLTDQLEDVRSGYCEAQFNLASPLPDVRVAGDGTLSSVFRNVLTNAVQHNDSETPRVTVAAEDGDETVEVRIADNGPGVPDARKTEIFGKGEHGADSSGAGLGLYLAATLVDRFGGDVWVTDNDPTGAVFHVELPKAESATNG